MKNYKCPSFPEKCATAMACRLTDPLTECPYDVRGKRDHCCVSMGHGPPPMGRSAKGHGEWIRVNANPDKVS